MNYLVDEFVFDLQLFAADFDPWADFDSDEGSEDVEPEVPEGTEEVSPDDIVSPEDAGADDFVYDADSADEETSSLLEELLNSDGVKDLAIDKSKCTQVEILDADGKGTGEYYYVITEKAIAAAVVDGEATIGGVQFNSSGSIVVNFGGNAKTGYTGVPTSFSAGNGEVVLGGKNGTAIDISDATSPVTVKLSEDGLPKEATVNGNATITVGNPELAVAEAGSESVEFAGFPTSVENTVEFSESGKHITAIKASTYEDGTITVTGALDYTLNGKDFELRNVKDGASYTFTNLADGDMQLNLSGVEAKNPNKPITIEDLGGVDEVIPPTATTGGSIKIAGDTYEYTTIANSEASFILDNDEVIAFTLDLTGDSITLDANSKIKVYDRDDVEEVYTEDVNANGGTYTFKKTDDGYNFDYTFTEAGNSIEILNEDADNVSLSYVDKKVTYEIVEPEVEGTYTVSMPTKGQFVYSGIDADAMFELDDAVISFENDGGAITLAATNEDDGTATLAITGIASDGGDIYFDEKAADLLADGITINGTPVQLDIDGAFVYDSDNATITVDEDTIYGIGNATHKFNNGDYTVANDADGVVKFTVDDNNNVVAIDDLDEGTVTGDFSTGVTVNGKTIQTDDPTLTVTGNKAGDDIADISGLADGAVTLAADSNLTINGTPVVIDSDSLDDIVITSDESGNLKLLGLVDGDAVTVGADTAVVLPTDGTGRDQITINGITYTIDGDDDDITITGDGVVTGLDEEAMLYVSDPVDLTVNGQSYTAAQVKKAIANNEAIVGYTTKAGTDTSYMEDVNYPIINNNTTSAKIMYEVLGLPVADAIVSEDGTQGDSLTSYDFTTDENKNTRAHVYLNEDGDNDVVFNDRGKNVAIVEDVESSTKNITLGNKDDVVIVTAGADDKYSKVNITGGTGNDTIVVQGEMPVTFDMSKGGDDKVVTYAAANARITIDGYSDTTGSGIVIHEPEANDIASAIESGLLVFEDGKIVTIDRDEADDGTDRMTEIVVNNTNADHQTLVRMFTYRDAGDSYGDDKGQLVGFTNSDGGKLDASDKSEDLILVGNTSGKKDGSELKAGKGDDTIYGGKGDTLDAGAGDNLVKLTDDGGAKVVISEGNTTVTGLTTGFSGGDIISLNSLDGVTFDGNNLVVSGDGYSATASVASADVVNQLVELNGQTLKAAIAADGKDITVSGSDVPNYFVGNAGVDFSNYSGDVVYDAANNGGSVGGEDAYFSKNITSITGGTGTTSLKGSDADDVFVAGTGATSLYGGAGNNTLVGNADQTSATEFFVLGNENGAANTIQNFQFGTDFINTDFEQNYISNVAIIDNDVKLTVTKREGTTSETALIEGAVDGGNIKVGSGGDAVAVGQFGSTAVTVDGEATYFDAVTNGATVKVASDVTTKTNIWLANEERSDGKIFSDKFAVIDASGSVAELELAGNTLANTITAGSGNASLWGGSGSASDVLIGGAGQNTFYYEQGNGADTVDNANDGDTVNLFDTSLENIVSADITSTGVVVQFTDGGSLTVNSTNAVNYQLSDGSTWTADHTNKTWTQKA